jgi:hypothetical protein
MEDIIMSEIKFYSEYDMACVQEIEKIIKKITENAIYTDWLISDLIEFHNIIKYIDIERFADYIAQQTGVVKRSEERYNIRNKTNS